MQVPENGHGGQGMGRVNLAHISGQGSSEARILEGRGSACGHATEDICASNETLGTFGLPFTIHPTSSLHVRVRRKIR